MPIAIRWIVAIVFLIGAPIGKPSGMFSVAWDLISAAALLAVVIYDIALPWRRAAWARRLRMRMTVADPESLISVVNVYEGDRPHAKLMVVDATGVMILNRSNHIESRISPPEILNITSHQRNKSLSELLVISFVSGSEELEFSPLGRLGIAGMGSYAISIFGQAMKKELSKSSPK